MSKKRIFCCNESGDGVEVVKICNARRFYRAHFLAGQAAEELRHNGRDASAGHVLRDVSAAYGLLGHPRTCTTYGLFEAVEYMRSCKWSDNDIYWPYVQNRLLDFLEASYIIGADYETTLAKTEKWGRENVT